MKLTITELQDPRTAGGDDVRVRVEDGTGKSWTWCGKYKLGDPVNLTIVGGPESADDALNSD